MELKEFVVKNPALLLELYLTFNPNTEENKLKEKKKRDALFDDFKEVDLNNLPLH